MNEKKDISFSNATLNALRSLQTRSFAWQGRGGEGAGGREGRLAPKMQMFHTARSTRSVTEEAGWHKLQHHFRYLCAPSVISFIVLPTLSCGKSSLALIKRELSHNVSRCDLPLFSSLDNGRIHEFRFPMALELSRSFRRTFEVFWDTAYVMFQNILKEY